MGGDDVATALLLDIQDDLTKSLVPAYIENGVLIPLKTTLELHEGHSCGQALITRTPVKCASAVIRLAFALSQVYLHAEPRSSSFAAICFELV